MKTFRTSVETSYKNDIAKTKIIDHKKQLVLVKKAQNGDMKAQDKLLTCNLKFIMDIALQYKSVHIKFADLISIGVMGMIKSIKMFEFEKNVNFLSYSIWWIRSYMQIEIIEKEKTIKLPSNIYTRIKKELNETKHESDITFDTYEYINMMKKHVSYNDVINDQPKGINLLWCDIIEDKDVVSPEHSVKKSNTKEVMVRSFLNRLSDTERYVITKIYGINTEKNTLLELAKELSTNINTIRKIIKQSIIKIKRHNTFILEKEIYNDFIETEKI